MPLIAGEAAGTRTDLQGTKMTFTKQLTSLAAAAAIAATSLVPLATTASAHDGYKDRDGYSRNWDGNGRGNRNWDGDYDGPRHYRAYSHHRHRDNTGKYIAIGLGALMLGIIASEAGRH
jgi:hypothetical protein